MVSTRGVKYKFSEGERVLCYEPDPTKAKVLYDSKVLEVIESKDKRGRRMVEYLIHFQGWNSSWDRCVSEDFVLKDTEENRQLQRDLAEKSQLQLGAYLYRRERKKGGSTNAGPAAKRARHGFSDDGSSSSTQPEDIRFRAEVEGDTDSSCGSACSRVRSPHPGPATLPLPPAIRDRLTFDYHLVVKRGRLSRLPATPSVVDVLESFVRWFARTGAWNTPRGRHDPPIKPDLLDVSCRLNLVREVADGLRIFFDAIAEDALLYKQERDQFQHVCGRFMDEDDKMIIEQAVEEDSQSQDEGLTSAEEDLKSPKLPEYSHLPPDPVSDEGEKSDALSQTNSSEEKENIMVKPETGSDKSVDRNEVVSDENSQPCQTEESKPATRSAMARRLRSHKSAVSQSENEEPAASTSTGEQRACETLSSSIGSSGSSMCESWPRAATPLPAPPTRSPLSQLIDKVAKWQLIPREGTDHLPSRVYGAIHLARLFVKIPEYLNEMQMPELKLKLILKHLEMFVQYLEEHSEWFGEVFYSTEINSWSHE